MSQMHGRSGKTASRACVPEENFQTANDERARSARRRSPSVGPARPVSPRWRRCRRTWPPYSARRAGARPPARPSRGPPRRPPSWAPTPAAAARQLGRAALPGPARDRSAAREARGSDGGRGRVRAAQQRLPDGLDAAGTAGRKAAWEAAQPRQRGGESGEADGLGQHSNRRALPEVYLSHRGSWWCASHRLAGCMHRRLDAGSFNAFLST